MKSCEYLRLFNFRCSYIVLIFPAHPKRQKIELVSQPPILTDLIYAASFRPTRFPKQSSTYSQHSPVLPIYIIRCTRSLAHVHGTIYAQEITCKVYHRAAASYALPDLALHESICLPRHTLGTHLSPSAAAPPSSAHPRHGAPSRSTLPSRSPPPSPLTSPSSPAGSVS